MSSFEASFVTSATSPEGFPRDGKPEVAFLGRSNVGKSSLLNALTGEKNLARISRTPGRTRTINFFQCRNALYLADLPGYGYARVPEALRRSWERLATSYLVDRAPLVLCLFLVDVRHDPSEGDRTLRAFLDHHALPYAVVATKADKLGRSEIAHRREALCRELGEGAREVVLVSTMTRVGLDRLWALIEGAVRREQARGQVVGTQP